MERGRLWAAASGSATGVRRTRRTRPAACRRSSRVRAARPRVRCGRAIAQQADADAVGGARLRHRHHARAARDALPGQQADRLDAARRAAIRFAARVQGSAAVASSISSTALRMVSRKRPSRSGRPDRALGLWRRAPCPVERVNRRTELASRADSEARPDAYAGVSAGAEERARQTLDDARREARQQRCGAIVDRGLQALELALAERPPGERLIRRGSSGRRCGSMQADGRWRAGAAGPRPVATRAAARSRRDEGQGWP